MGINKRLIGAGVAAEQGAVGFNAIAYSGNSNSNRSFTGLGFQPDIIWIKGRNNSEQHYFYDSTRGSSKFQEQTQSNEIKLFSIKGVDY